ncbi:MAG TPA: hypothetical protein VF386_01195, partial [Usitatibacter sp.]
MLIATLCVPLAASVPSRCEDAVAPIGKQRAAGSANEWDVRDVNHPLMGPIRAAVQRRSVVTTAGSNKVLSLAFVSCQKSTGKIAIELANAAEGDARGGLGPVDLPRLVCNSPRPQGDGALAKSDLAASWEISTLGDALARGLSPAALRKCASIDVLQNVALPPASGVKSQKIAMELTPYGKELDAVFAACGEATAFASEVRPAPALPQVARIEPPPKLDPPPRAEPAPKVEASPTSDPGTQSGDARWRPARTIAKGRTNVRAGDSLNSAVVTQL